MIKKSCHLIRQEVQLAKPNQKKVVPDVSLANQPYVKIYKIAGFLPEILMAALSGLILEK